MPKFGYSAHSYVAETDIGEMAAVIRLKSIAASRVGKSVFNAAMAGSATLSGTTILQLRKEWADQLRADMAEKVGIEMVRAFTEAVSQELWKIGDANGKQLHSKCKAIAGVITSEGA